MRVKNWKNVLAVLGVSIMLSGCLEIEATTTVLEDGRVIDTMVVQPKNSMLTLLALSARGMNTADSGSDTTAGRKVGEVRRLMSLQDLRTFGNVCKLADAIYKEALTRQEIPYSAATVPITFEFSEIAGNGCSIQIGPYDPRTLPADFAMKVFGIRIEPATGFYEPYRISVFTIGEALADIPSRELMDVAELQAVCSGELEPALCQQELRILMVLIGSWNMEGEESAEFRDILSDPGMLGGAAEILRMVLKSVPVTLRIPDNTAVSTVRGTSAFEYGQGWIWRGSAMEWITGSTNPGMSLEVRPTRLPAPSTR